MGHLSLGHLSLGPVEGVRRVIEGWDKMFPRFSRRLFDSPRGRVSRSPSRRDPPGVDATGVTSHNSPTGPEKTGHPDLSRRW